MNERASYYSGSSAEMKQCAGMLGAVEGRHPALVKTALPGEVQAAEPDATGTRRDPHGGALLFCRENNDRFNDRSLQSPDSSMGLSVSRKVHSCQDDRPGESRSVKCVHFRT
jgi:hypothetical protein